MYVTQQIANRLRLKAKAENKKIGKLLSDCGLGINALSEFSKGKQISCISLAMMADEVDCSVDYLLGRTDNPQAHKSQNVVYGDLSNNSGIVGNVGSTINTAALNVHAAALLELFNKLDPIKQSQLVVYANELSKNKE